MREKDVIDVKSFYNRKDFASDYYEGLEQGGGDEFFLVTSLMVKTLIPSFTSKSRIMVDMGSGTGNAIKCFNKIFNLSQITAIDLCDKMLSCLNEFQPNVRTMEADLLKDRVSIENSSVDFITCSCVIPYMSSIDNLFREASRILKIGGVFAFNAVVFEANYPEMTKVLDSRLPVQQYYYSENKIASLAIQNNLGCVYFMDQKNGKIRRLPISPMQKIYIMIKK